MNNNVSPGAQVAGRSADGQPEAYTAAGAESPDQHRFSAEPPVPKSRRAGQVVFVFVCLLALIGGGTWLAKRYIRESAAAREEAKKAKERLAKVEASRKGKVFVFDPKDSPSAPEAAASGNLPRAFRSGNGAASTVPPESADAIPRRGEVKGGAAGQAAPGGAGRSAPLVHATMMVDAPAAIERASTVDRAPSTTAAPLRVEPTPSAESPAPRGAPPGAGGLFGSGAPGAAASAPLAGLQPRGVGRRTVQDFARLQAIRSPVTGTAQASAANIGDRSMLLARGSFIPCILQTQLFSTVPGQSSCLVPEDVYSDDGSTLLIEKGSAVSGSYGPTMKVGDTRIAVVWSRIKTTTGVVIDVESQASDGVGTMGVDGYLDNHWPERIGAALLLSLIEDAVSIEVAKQGGSSVNGQNSATAGTTRNMSEKVLSSTINIPPTLAKQRGTRLAIYVNRDLWFDSVYALVKR